MSTCPNCGSKLNGDFGMVICSSCQAAVFIDFDGNAQISKPEDQDFTQDSKPIEYTPDADQYIDENFNQKIDQYTIDEAKVISGATEEQSSNQMLDTKNHLNEDLSTQTDSKSSDYNFSDVIDFANQLNPDTPISFDIKIEGIDWADIKKEVFENLNDSKLALDLKALAQSIKNGVLEIKQINSVKATVILRRLEHLQVKISWRQYVATHEGQ